MLQTTLANLIPSNKRVGRQKTDGSQEFYSYGVDGKKLGTYTVTAFTAGSPGALQLSPSSTNLYFAGKLIQSINGAVVTDRLGSVRQVGSTVGCLILGAGAILSLRRRVRRGSPDSRYLLRVTGCGAELEAGTVEALNIDNGTTTPIRSSRCKVYTVSAGWVSNSILPRAPARMEVAPK